MEARQSLADTLSLTAEQLSAAEQDFVATSGAPAPALPPQNDRVLEAVVARISNGAASARESIEATKDRITLAASRVSGNAPSPFGLPEAAAI